MTITRITWYAAPIRLTEPFVISLGPLTHANNVFVRLETDTGLTGWGEASPFPTVHGETMEGVLTLGRFLGPLLLGYPLGTRGPAKIIELLDGAIFGNSCAKSALEIACYDLAARQVGMPLYQYLGGKNRPLWTDYTVSLGAPEAMAHKARWIVEQGFPAVKLKLGRADRDYERVAAVRAVIGPDLPLRLDANQGWTRAEALDLLPRLERFAIQHCEAPIDRRDFIYLPALRAATRIPLMADEACWDHDDARRLIELGAIDRVNIKLSKSGGLTKALKILHLARKHELPVQVGGFLETRLGFTAAAHFGALAGIDFHDFDTPLMQETDPILGGMVYGDNGRVTLPDIPGLGAEPDPAYLRELQQFEVT